MNKKIKEIKEIKEILESVRHELVTLNGLVAYDGESLSETWIVDTQKAIAKIDVITQPSQMNNQPS